MDLSDYEIPRVLVTCRNGQPIRGKHVEALINSEAFKTLDGNDAVSLCCVGILQLVLLGLEDRRPTLAWPLYATQPTNEVDTKSYSLTGFLWAFKGQLPVERLVPDEIEARSPWWVSSRAYFDGRNIKDVRIPRHLNRNNYVEVPSEMYREFEEQRRGYRQMMQKSDDMSDWSWPEGWLSGDHMNAWIQMLIRERAENDNWTCLNPVYMPINDGGVHWVTGAINLVDSIFYVFDSMESESRMLMLEQQVRDWTPIINRILQMRGSAPERRKIDSPRTVTRIKTDEKGVFEMLFIALGASIRTFVNYLRPLLIIDAAHLKGQYKGTNLIAVGMDGNNQIVPIAFGICKGETGPCWSWWMSVLKECIGDNPNLLFISDRHAAIALAVQNEFPLAYHVVCCRHLMMNLSLKRDRTRLYLEIMQAYTTEDFSSNMSHLQDIQPDAYDKLCQVGPQRWSRAHRPLVRYNYLTSNSVNAYTVVYRKLPVLKLAETYRAMVQDWYYKCHKLAEDVADSLHVPLNGCSSPERMFIRTEAVQFDVAGFFFYFSYPLILILLLILLLLLLLLL
ncbi:transposase, MuDR, MULE transposase domain protein [Tanacetum coccineum]|uniref:Transposase, MuDR, MULE transposase domain protein n=1 Tax=Tanacetum coccineum TaxID=301880 RepID=A0ABQ4XZ23_9ASTR